MSSSPAMAADRPFVDRHHGRSSPSVAGRVSGQVPRWARPSVTLLRNGARRRVLMSISTPAFRAALLEEKTSGAVERFMLDMPARRWRSALDPGRVLVAPREGGPHGWLWRIEKRHVLIGDERRRQSFESSTVAGITFSSPAAGDRRFDLARQYRT